MPEKTQHYQLNQWDPSDSFLRADFNGDNAKIDAALKALDNKTETKADQSAVTAALAQKSKIVAGAYTGDDEVSRTIPLGFRPSAVLVVRQDGAVGGSCSYAVVGGLALEGFPAQKGDDIFIQVVDGGFQVLRGQHRSGTYFLDPNKDGSTYYYIAVC